MGYTRANPGGAPCQGAIVALRLLPDAWRERDEEADFWILQARNLLFEFVGGEPGAQLRDQFA